MVYIEIPALPSAITPEPPKKMRVRTERSEVEAAGVERTLTPISREEGRKLDGFLLLAAGDGEDPLSLEQADLSSLGIDEVLGDDIPYFANLRNLDLSDNAIADVDVLQTLSCLPRVGRLSLACNHLVDLSLTDVFVRLEVLDLSFNELQGEVLPVIASGCARLRSLDLSNNCVSSVPPCGGFTSLTELNLGSNDLVQFDQWRALEQLPVLATLNLAKNRIKRLKNEVAVEPSFEDKQSCFRSLIHMDLSGNEIADLAHLSVLADFPVLRTVDVFDNPAEIASSKFPTNAIRFVLDIKRPGSFAIDTRGFVTVPEQRIHARTSPWAKYQELHGGVRRVDPQTDAGLVPLADVERRLRASRSRLQAALDTIDAQTYPSAMRTPPFTIDKTTEETMQVMKRLATPEFFAKLKPKEKQIALLDDVVEGVHSPKFGVSVEVYETITDKFDAQVPALVDAPESVRDALTSLRLH